MEIVERIDNVLVFYLVCLVKRIDKKSITKKKKKKKLFCSYRNLK